MQGETGSTGIVMGGKETRKSLDRSAKKESPETLHTPNEDCNGRNEKKTSKYSR
jgi:hypothetical protein